MPTDIADSLVRGLADRGGVPWKATDAMKERTKFVLEWERRWNEAEGGPVGMAELCRMFGGVGSAVACAGGPSLA